MKKYDVVITFLSNKNNQNHDWSMLKNTFIIKYEYTVHIIILL